jgi:hypothetical protein
MGKQRPRKEDLHLQQAGLELDLKRVRRVLESPQLMAEALGSYVVINAATGEYVVRSTLMQASDEFRQQFPGAAGFTHRLGEPLFVDS